MSSRRRRDKAARACGILKGAFSARRGGYKHESGGAGGRGDHGRKSHVAAAAAH